MKTLVIAWFVTLFAMGGALAKDPPASPTSLVIVACRVVDWTGKRPLPEGVYPTPKWRDLELFINKDQEYECKRVRVDLEDSVILNSPQQNILPLHPDWSQPSQCGKVGVVLAQEWNEHNPGWATVGIGCPSPIWDDQGTPDARDDRIVGFKLPECPSFLPGTQNRMRCIYDDSEI